MERNGFIIVNSRTIGFAAWKGILWGVIFLILWGGLFAVLIQYGISEARIGVALTFKPELLAEYNRLAQQVFPLYLLGYLVRNFISFVAVGAALRVVIELIFPGKKTITVSGIMAFILNLLLYAMICFGAVK